MLTAIIVTFPPVLFLIVLFGGGILSLRKKHIDQDGDSPINRTLFYTSKWSVVILWVAMMSQVWGIHISLINVPTSIGWIALPLWFFGFTMLFLGRFKLGSSFRLGTPKENISLMTDGLYRFSRNPMYLGLYSTIVASALYTLNPVVILLGGYVITVHHTIVLGEEAYMQKTFGQKYLEYCRQVRRYI